MANLRETEYSTLSQCHFQVASLQTVEQNDVCADLLENVPEDIPCVVSASNAVVRIQPKTQNNNDKKKNKRNGYYLRWDGGSHFHEEFQLPDTTDSNTTTTTTSSGLCFFVQAIAREGVAIVLSPKKGFAMGESYEVILGDSGNTQVSLQRKSSSKNGDVLSVHRPARVCQERAWTSYWVCLCDGKLYVGVGDKIGHRCIAMLDDIAKQDQPPTEENRIRYVGVGNAGKGDRQPPVALKVRRLMILPLSQPISNKLKNLEENDLEFITLGEEEMDDETKKLMIEYEKECKKARARAEKFGLPYKEPPSFIPWSQARKLRANPQQGFATGFDLSDPAEKAKQDARKKRFGIQDNDTADNQEATAPDLNDNVEAQFLPIEQAWDNETMVKSQRVDPPPHLWKDIPEADVSNRDDGDVSLVPEKIHLFSIDWAAFKQIRTNDVMKHFSIYGPTYVEWLGDLSCNIIFQDKFSANRALHNLSVEIPSPPPFETGDEDAKDETHSRPDLGQMGWRLGKTLLRKIADDRFGRRGTTARFLLRVASSADILHERPTSWPKPPAGFSTKKVLGPQANSKNNKKNTEAKKKNKKRDREDHDSTGNKKHEISLNDKGEPALLDHGLAASRKGFSLEELEQERASKKAKS